MRRRDTAGDRCHGCNTGCSQAVYAEPLPADEPIATAHCCSLLELSEERCRWPISTPGAEDFCFCGNTPVEGLPYCPGHTRLAYRPGSRQRVARG